MADWSFRSCLARWASFFDALRGCRILRHRQESGFTDQAVWLAHFYTHRTDWLLCRFWITSVSFTFLFTVLQTSWVTRRLWCRSLPAALLLGGVGMLLSTLLGWTLFPLHLVVLSWCVGMAAGWPATVRPIGNNRFFSGDQRRTDYPLDRYTV